MWNKKAQDGIAARKTIFYIIFGFVAVAVFFIIVIIVPKTNVEIITIRSGLEDYLLTERFLSARECFPFHDNLTGRTYPGTIDLERFTNQQIKKCYSANDQNVPAYRLTLKYGNQPQIMTPNWEGFIFRSATERVSVYDNGKQTRADMLIEIQDAK